MRKFSSYGPVDKDIHYYVPRTELVKSACRRLCGENPEKGGHYITVWAPRQCGKTWAMREAAETIRQQGKFEIALISMQSAKTKTTDEGMLDLFTTTLAKFLGRELPKITSWKNFSDLFSGPYFEKPLVLIIYAVQLKLKQIYLILFIESIDDENRQQLETVHHNDETGVDVRPFFVETGNFSGQAAEK